jgi:hypothetical protein
LAPRETAREILSELGLSVAETTIDAFAGSVDRHRIGKFRGMPRRKRREVEAVLRPTLESFGYGLGEELPRPGGWFRRR